MKRLKTIMAVTLLAASLSLSGAIGGIDQVEAATTKSPCAAIDRVLAKVSPQSRLYKPMTIISKQCHVAFPATT